MDDELLQTMEEAAVLFLKARGYGVLHKTDGGYQLVVGLADDGSVSCSCREGAPNGSFDRLISALIDGRRRKCEACRGTGWDGGQVVDPETAGGSEIPCEKCDGDGYIKATREESLRYFLGELVV